MRNNLNKLILRKGVVLSGLIAFFCFRVLSDLPLPYAKTVEILVMALSVLFVIAQLLVPYLLRQKKIKVSGLELYVFFLMTCLPIYSAWRASDVFGQPILYGVLTQRSMLLLCFVLLMIDWMRKGLIRPEHIRDVLLFMAWCWLAFWAFMQQFINPKIFLHDYPAIVSGGGLSGYSYKFEPILIVFAGLYYFFCGILKRNSNDYLKALPFLLFIFLVLDKRSLSIVMPIAIIATIWFFLRKARFVSLSMKWIVLGGFIFVVLSASAPEQVARYFGHFQEALSVVLTGEKAEDVSANARILQTTIAWPYIQENWFLGNGDLSGQWYGGYDRVMGYFYPSDIGLIGAWFVYGVLGLLIFYGQYFFILKRKSFPLDTEQKILWLSCYATIFVLFLQSFIRGGLVFVPAMSLFFISIVYGLSFQSGYVYRKI